MYAAIKPVSRTNNFKFNPNAGYRFAAQENFCPLFLQELARAVREYFICFPDNGTDLPHAVLGFEQGVNRYVTADGLWQADYIPVFFRRYPFTLARRPDSRPGAANEFTLVVDAEAPHLADPNGEPIFTPDGQPSPVLQDRIKLLQAIDGQQKITRQAIAQIEAAGLFNMQEVTVMAGSRKVAAISGLRIVDEERLADCGLKPGPAMEIVYAHLFSKANLRQGVLACNTRPSFGRETAAAEPAECATISFDGEFIRFD
jgi:hypothetical protein